MNKFESTQRQQDQDDDFVGREKTYEARIRGALTPFTTLAQMIPRDLSKHGELKELTIKLADDCMNKHLPKLLKLLKNSETDRQQMVDVISLLERNIGYMP